MTKKLRGDRDIKIDKENKGAIEDKEDREKWRYRESNGDKDRQGDRDSVRWTET